VSGRKKEKEEINQHHLRKEVSGRRERNSLRSGRVAEIL
jgi:hypothetical protein